MRERRARFTLTSFLRDPREHDSYKSHTVHVTHAKEARTITEDHDQDDEDTDVDSALPALNEDDSADLEEHLCARDTPGLQGVTTTARRTARKPWLQTCDRAYQWEKALASSGSTQHWARECPKENT